MTPTAIIKKVSKISGIPIKELKSEKKTRRIVQPRQIAMVLIRKSGKSQEITGAYFNKDHSTVSHAEWCVNVIAPANKDFMELLEKINSEFESN